MKKFCLICNKQFNIIPSREGTAKYCSNVCRFKSVVGNEIWKNRTKDYQGKNNPAWKGSEVGYRAVHLWVQKKLGKAKRCRVDNNHISTRYHWANISKQYKRDLTDWTEMCPSCNSRDRIERRVSP